MRPSMSDFLPAPLTMVVFSFSTVTFLARPSMLIVTFSSLAPRSADTMVPPVRIAMSSSIALRRSPKPGALTAATLRPPRSLFTTRVRKCLAFYIFGNHEERLAGLHHRFEERQQLVESREFLFIDQNVWVLHFDPHLLGVGDEVRRDVAAIKLHTLDYFELGRERLRLLRGDNPLVANLLHGIGNKAANLFIAVSRNRADLGNLLVRGHVFRMFLQIGNNRCDSEV